MENAGHCMQPQTAIGGFQDRGDVLQFGATGRAQRAKPGTIEVGDAANAADPEGVATSLHGEDVTNVQSFAG